MSFIFHFTFKQIYIKNNAKYSAIKSLNVHSTVKKFIWQHICRIIIIIIIIIFLISQITKSLLTVGFKPGITFFLRMVHWHQNMSELCM
jgi:uncharacterized integral membrane protein